MFTFLSELEQRGAVVCLGGIWRLLVELPRQQAQPFGPVAQRPTRAELVAKRRNEVKATLQRIVAKLDAADRDEFESDIKEWWTCPLFGRSTPLDIISVGNYQWERLKKQLAAIENALNSDTPDLGEPLGLPMSAAIAAHAARAAILETERGLRRCEGLRAKALQKFDAEVAEIWLATRPFQKGQSPLEHAMASDSGLKTSLEALERRFVHRGSIPVIREDFQVWVTKKFGNRGLRFIHRRNDGLPDRRTPLQCCYDEVSLAGMRELTLRAAPFT
ncbi:hypothetical protein [Rhizobium sp. 28DA2]|uniref:hypothetical protein n=1 Tax=Rhizobium sp. 28DA2 TaxID=3035209 RepID=UPI002B24D396|nr:hypothetical protein [Rhizobium sp. 28DA2]